MRMVRAIDLLVRSELEGVGQHTLADEQVCSGIQQLATAHEQHILP